MISASKTTFSYKNLKILRSKVTKILGNLLICEWLSLNQSINLWFMNLYPVSPVI